MSPVFLLSMDKYIKSKLTFLIKNTNKTGIDKILPFINIFNKPRGYITQVLKKKQLTIKILISKKVKYFLKSTKLINNLNFLRF